MRKTTTLAFVVAILSAVASRADRRPEPAGGVLDGYQLGVTLRQLDTADFLIADVPFIRGMLPLGSEAVQLGYGGHLMWGLTDFFVEWTYATGIHVFPFGRRLGFHVTGHLGSFFLDNISVMGAVGVQLDVPLGGDGAISLGVESFYRSSRDLIDYVSFPELSSPGERPRDEAINLDSRGIGVSLGVRF